MDAETIQILTNFGLVIGAAVVTAVVQYFKTRQAKKALTDQAQTAANQGDTLYATAEKTLTVIEALFPKASVEVQSAKSIMVTIKAIWDDEKATDEQLLKAYADYSQLMDSLMAKFPKKAVEDATIEASAN